MAVASAPRIDGSKLENRTRESELKDLFKAWQSVGEFRSATMGLTIQGMVIESFHLPTRHGTLTWRMEYESNTHKIISSSFVAPT